MHIEVLLPLFQNLHFLRNEYMPLAHKALPMWISLLSSAERAQRGSKEEMLVPLEYAAILMDLAGIGHNRLSNAA